MVEILLVLAGAIVGFAIAWFFGGKTREQLAEARVKLSHTELRLQETQILLTETKADLSAATVALNAQSAMRAAAEVLNARMPQLDDELDSLRTEAAVRRFSDDGWLAVTNFLQIVRGEWDASVRIRVALDFLPNDLRHRFEHPCRI